MTPKTLDEHIREVASCIPYGPVAQRSWRAILKALEPDRRKTMDSEIATALDKADEALTNLPDVSEAFTSAVEAARSAINAARAIARDGTDA